LKPRLTWEYNIEMYLKGMVCEDVDRIHVAQYRVQWRDLMNMAVNLQIPLQGGISWPTVGLHASQEG